MNARSFHLSAQGSSHIKKNKECQDSSTSYQDDDCAIAIVCDGHGGDDYFRSAIGSSIACEVAEKNIKEFIKTLSKDEFFSKPEQHLKDLEGSIVFAWTEAVNAYHEEHPFQESELVGLSEKARKKYVEEDNIESAYGTTLIAVAMNSFYWFGIHIGDGKCVAINPEGEFKQPIPWDPKCFLNATTSICDSDARDRCRHFYSEKLPAAVFVGSDGIDDCFSNNEQLHNLYKTVLFSFATTDFDEACEGLKDYLPRLSAKGSGDDVSIAAILDLDLIPELSMVKDFDREKEKARVEENARKEAERNEAERRRVEEEHARFQQQNNAKARMNQNRKGFTICKICGEHNKLGAKFCNNCGNPFESDLAQNSETASNKDNFEVKKVDLFSSEPDNESVLAEGPENEYANTSSDEAVSDIENDESLREDVVADQISLDFPNSSVETTDFHEVDSVATEEDSVSAGTEATPTEGSDNLDLCESEPAVETEADNSDIHNTEKENKD